MVLMCSTAASSRGSTVWVAPSSRASASFSGIRSAATMMEAPAARAPNRAASPTPPRPTIATDWPAFRPDVLTTAPTPVSTAQPKSAACSKTMSLSMRTSEVRETTACPANAETPTWWNIGWPWLLSRIAPPSSVPAPFAAAPGSHSAGRPSAQGTQWPQDGMNTITTWSPTSRSRTPSPSCSTMPAASWPSAIGSGRGRSPLMTDRSEWQSPAALIATRTSPGPGASSSISSTERGRDCA